MIHTYESNEQRQGQNMLFTNKLLRRIVCVSDAKSATFSVIPLAHNDIV